jgi:hypothetical protein
VGYNRSLTMGHSADSTLGSAHPTGEAQTALVELGLVEPSPVQIGLRGGWRAEIFHSWNLSSTVREHWEQAAQAYGDRGLFLSPGWFETWWGVFGKDGRLFIAVLYSNADLKGIFPCWVGNDGVVRAMSNELYFDFLLQGADPSDPLRKFLDLLAQTGHPNAHFVTLSRMEGNGAALLELLARARFPFWIWREKFGPIVDVSRATWEELEATFQSKLRNNLKKGRRKAEKEGTLEFEEVRDSASILQILDEAFAVEGSGWKAKEGTAIAQDSAKVEWYRRISLWAAERGALRVYLLRLNGRLIAFDLALESGRTVFALKTGYDENIATRFSAGNLMRCEVLKLLQARPDIDRYDFLGATYPWKLEWTQFSGESIDVFVYPRTLRGWTRYFLQYGWKQPIKRRSAKVFSSKKTDSQET